MNEPSDPGRLGWCERCTRPRHLIDGLCAACRAQLAAEETQEEASR